MSVSQAFCTSMKVGLLTKLYNLTNSTDTIKLALFRAQASITSTYGAGTTNYSDMGADEASGTNYSAGGSALTSVTPISSGTTAICDFADLVFSNVTITASGALIYDSTASGAAFLVLNFGADKTTTAADMTIIFPTADVNNAIIRLV